MGKSQSMKGVSGNRLPWVREELEEEEEERLERLVLWLSDTKGIVFKTMENKAGCRAIQSRMVSSITVPASNFLLKPFYLTRGFVTFHGCHQLYLGTFYSFLSVRDTGP